MADSIRFYFRGEIRTLSDVPPTRTVLQLVREDLRATGTKEGCAEGDCGACTVVNGELRDGRLVLEAVNACIQFVPTLDGKALFTVEDLRQPDGGLHPVQQAMVDCHGSQCGFCTPGFVMSLWALYETQRAAGRGAPTRAQIDTALSGNLCRCTGYRPIIDAAQRMFALPPAAFDGARVTAALLSISRDAALEYVHGERHFFAPRDLDTLATLRVSHPQARLLAGSTDVGLWVTKQLRDLGDIVYLGRVAELQSVVERDGWLEIGAGASLNIAYEAAARHYGPTLHTLWQRFASLPIRNAGTLGGNVANGSPIGDSMPWLLAAGAELVLRHGPGPTATRTLPLDAFYLDYQKTALASGEFVQTIRLPLPAPDLRFATYKLSKRWDQDISAVCAAFALRVADGVVGEVRIAYGGMAATPRRALLAEAALKGKPWTAASVDEAVAALARDFTPLTDMRASATYRMRAAQNLLRRFWLEHGAPPSATPVSLDAFLAATATE